jgi:hypothetical protein
MALSPIFIISVPPMCVGEVLRLGGREGGVESVRKNARIKFVS